MGLRTEHGVSSIQRDALVAIGNVSRGDLWRLIGFASKDIELAGAVASLPWFLDGVRGGVQHALDALEDIASQDHELARLLTDAPWLEDGIVSTENNVLRDVRSIALMDLELARMTKSLPWLYDTITDGESAAILTLARIASEDPKLARTSASLRWFVDGLNRNEHGALASLAGIASLDQELAGLVVETPWFDDGITDDESAGLGAVRASLDALSEIGLGDSELLEIAMEIPWLEAGWSRDLYRYYLLSLLWTFQMQGTDALAQLTARPWFADGLSEQEAALVVTLSGVGDASLYRDLLEAYHTQNKTVSLSLAGDVSIWVIQTGAFPAEEDLLTIIEDSARVMEEFLKVPFPTTDIILLVADEVHNWTGTGGFHAGTYMVLNRYDGNEVEVPYVPHETAHYYMKGSLGPTWLVEGGAEFLVAYINDLTDVQGLKARRIEVARKTQNHCIDYNELENIRHLDYVFGGRAIMRCQYTMGENLLHVLVETLGEAAMRAALRELYLLTLDPVSDDAVEERTYLTFLKHVPADRKEAFRELYQRLHGGQFAFPDTDLSDDHADEAMNASEVEVGELVEGTLNYMWDFDYFRFQAEVGQVYLVSVHHEELRPLSISVYGPDGQTQQAWMIRDKLPTGPRMLWEAQSSSEHYFAVQNFGGKTGQYTFTITPFVTIPDDHGDTPGTATDIPVKGSVKGTIDHSSDIDVFRFAAVEGRHTIMLRLGTLEEGTLITYSPKVVDRTRGRVRIAQGTVWSWQARTTGEYYYIVAGSNGSVGTYTLVTDED